jgi:allantoin racemase
MPGVIRIINPNSNPAVTQGMSEAVEPLRLMGGPNLDCVTLEDGPFGIESQDHVDAVIPMLAEWVRTDQEAAAFVIGCYSDPGLALCREQTAKPVLGIAESAILTALTRGGSFGVISILSASIPRHEKHLRERNLHHQCAGDRALELSVAEVEAGTETFPRMLEIGTQLRDEDGAEVIIMGCAGMAKHRKPLEAALSMPVIDPTQAAASLAFGAVALG